MRPRSGRAGERAKAMPTEIVRFRLWFATLAALLASLLPACTAGAAEAASKSRPPFRVMTYNIHHGEGLDGKVDLERIAELIRKEKADIVALQEVDKGTERTAKRDFPAEFARLTGMSCIFSNNYHYQGGQYGNATLTRFPVKSATNSLYRMVRPGEQRGLLQVVLDVSGRDLVLMNTHIDYRPDDTERLANVAELREIIRSYEGTPIILCGDFNDVPNSRTAKAVAEHFIDGWTVAASGNGYTIPAAGPTKRIDYIWVSKDAPLKPVKMWVPESNASDHLPVVAEFTWTD